MSDVQVEPLPGLPALPPEGERILWQGAPRWRALALRCFHVGWLAAYFSVFLIARFWAAIADGMSGIDALGHMLWTLPLALIGLGLVVGLAWLHARTTMYTITSKRVVMRYGIAMPMTVNLPFRQIGSAALKVYSDGAGDIPLSMTGRNPLGFFHLWPHARPWCWRTPEPMLRAVADAESVATTLQHALQSFHGRSMTTPRVEPTEERSERAPQLATAGGQ